MESARVGKRGAIVVPAKLRKGFGIEEGTVVNAEEREDGILIRPAVVVPIEKYTPPSAKRSFFSSMTAAADYRKARTEVPTHWLSAGTKSAALNPLCRTI
jgi:AbrB family looped-hinge helix DNA binding protein